MIIAYSLLMAKKKILIKRPGKAQEWGLKRTIHKIRLREGKGRGDLKRRFTRVFLFEIK